MVDNAPEFETTDKLGSTDEFTGLVGSTAILIPPVAGTKIDEISIKAAIDQPAARRLEFSFNGTDWFRLSVGESREEEPRGDIRQVYIRAAGPLSQVNYEIVMNRGPL